MAFLPPQSAAFGVNVTQRHYQAEETHSITLEWTFTTHPHRPWTLLKFYCELITEHTSSFLTELIHVGDELEEFVGEQFLGRVQMDRDALREGRIRLHVSRLRTEDSGWYLCEVETDQGFGSESCRLNVTAAADHPEPQRPTQGPEPGSPRWIRIYILLGPTALIVAILLILVISHRRSIKLPERKESTVGNLGLRALPKDSSTCGLKEHGVEPLTVRSVGSCSFLLSHSRPD
ncbi:uncharacterized protein ACNS7B_020909 isoform 2-T3 [Menidia menidia]